MGTKNKLELVTKEYLRKAYWDERKTLSQIANELDVTKGAIWQKMKRFHIPRRVGQFLAGHDTPDEICQKVSQSLKGRSPTRGFKGWKHSLETRQKFSQQRKGVPKKKYTLIKPRKGVPTGCSPSAETRRKQSITMKVKGQYPPWWLAPKFERHTEQAKAKMKNVWCKRKNNEAEMQAWVQALHLKPNKGEILLDTILQQNFPGCWKYTGDGLDGTQIGGKIPDWINVNGKKAVLELFGDFWHQEKTRTVEATAKHYKKYGFACLIIDYRELREPRKVRSKVGVFLRET